VVVFTRTDFLSDFQVLAKSTKSLLAVVSILDTTVEARCLAGRGIQFIRDN